MVYMWYRSERKDTQRDKYTVEMRTRLIITFAVVIFCMLITLDTCAAGRKDGKKRKPDETPIKDDSDEKIDGNADNDDSDGQPMSALTMGLICFGVLGITVVASYVAAYLMCDEGMEEMRAFKAGRIDPETGTGIDATTNETWTNNKQPYNQQPKQTIQPPMLVELIKQRIVFSKNSVIRLERIFLWTSIQKTKYFGSKNDNMFFDLSSCIRIQSISSAYWVCVS